MRLAAGCLRIGRLRLEVLKRRAPGVRGQAVARAATMEIPNVVSPMTIGTLVTAPWAGQVGEPGCGHWPPV